MFKAVIFACLFGTMFAFTCDECNMGISKILERFNNEESLMTQGQIQADALCPGSPDPERCFDELPKAWMTIGAIVWPIYLDAKERCDEFCMKKPLLRVTCEECDMVVKRLFEFIMAKETMDGMVEYLSGEGFCAATPDPMQCADEMGRYYPAAIKVLIEYGTPLVPGLCQDIFGVC